MSRLVRVFCQFYFSLLWTITNAQVSIITSLMAQSSICSQNSFSLKTIENTGKGTQKEKKNLMSHWYAESKRVKYIEAENRPVVTRGGEVLAKEYKLPRLVCPSGLSADLWTERSLVRFPVRAHAWAVGQVPSWGRARSNWSMFLSLSFSLPSPFSKNK